MTLPENANSREPISFDPESLAIQQYNYFHAHALGPVRDFGDDISNMGGRLFQIVQMYYDDVFTYGTCTPDRLIPLYDDAEENLTYLMNRAYKILNIIRRSKADLVEETEVTEECTTSC